MSLVDFAIAHCRVCSHPDVNRQYKHGVTQARWPLLTPQHLSSHQCLPLAKLTSKPELVGPQVQRPSS